MRTKKSSHSLYEVHHRPEGITRREFVARGGAALAWSWLMLPSLTTFLARSAMAATESCVAPLRNSTRVPFFAIDLVGGGSLAGSNVMVGGRGGQTDFLGSYGKLGIPAALHPKLSGNVNEELGLKFYQDSGILRGIRAVTSTATRSRTDGMVFCAASNDDTINNPHNPTYWIAKSGTRGDLGDLIGSRNSESGGNSRVPTPSFDPSLRPVAIQTPADAMALVQTGQLERILTRTRSEKVLRAMRNMSQSALARFEAADLSTQLKELVACGYVQAHELVQHFPNPSELDYREDLNVNAAAAAALLDAKGSADFPVVDPAPLIRAASAAKLVLDGYCGAATLESPGHDYHVGARVEGERRDRQAGLMIGISLEAAARKNKDVMIYVFTDGCTSTDESVDPSPMARGKNAWVSDGGEASSSFLLVHRARDMTRADAPLLKTEAHRQIGWFRESGAKAGVDRNATLVSNSVTDLTKAVVANYLALHGEEGRLTDLVGSHVFGNQLDQYVGLRKLRG